MSSPCRVLKGNSCEITQGYQAGVHNGIDITGKGYTLDYIKAHSSGTVIACRKDCKGFEGNNSYGNYIKIQHDNGYCTLYAHLAYGTVNVYNGMKVSKGQIIAYMGNTGYSFGGHLHFEVWKDGVRINPTPYLNASLPKPAPAPTPVTPSNKYKVGDKVTINGVYVSSTSSEKLIPAYTSGTITQVINGAANPYLIDNGNLGWVNDACIVGNAKPVDNSIKVGDIVSIKRGAKSYEGVYMETFVYDRKYRVDELYKDRAVLDVKGLCTAFNVKDLIK